MPGVNAYKRGSTWRYRFEAAPVGGKRQRVEKSGFRTKKEALAAGTKAYNEYLNVGRVFTPSEMSFSDYLDEWLELRKPELKYNSVLMYTKLINIHIKPVLGKYKLSSIAAADIQKLVNDLFNAGVSRNTIAGVKGVVSGALKYAVLPLGYLQVAPVQGVRMPSHRVQQPIPAKDKPRTPITKADWAKITQLLQGKSAYLAFVIAYHTGMRVGEVLGLVWDDVDFDGRVLHVRRQLTGNTRRAARISAPKYDSCRDIGMDDTLKSVLAHARVQQSQIAFTLADEYPEYYRTPDGRLGTDGQGERMNFVCRRASGVNLMYSSIQRAAEQVREHLKLCSFDFHTLRHTHATMLVEEGISPLLVQDRLGHKDIQVTLGLYASLTDKTKQQEMQKINALLRDSE